MQGGVLLLACGSCLAIAVGCGPSGDGEAPGATHSALRGDDMKTSKVIGHLRTRDHAVTIQSGEGGPVFTVEGRDGRILDTEISLQDLQAKFPGVYEAYRSSLARRGILDASGPESHTVPRPSEY